MARAKREMVVLWTDKTAIVCSMDEATSVISKNLADGTWTKKSFKMGKVKPVGVDFQPAQEASLKIIGAKRK